GTSFNSITISGSNYTLGGNSLVTAAVTVNPGTVSNTVSLNATLASVSVGAGSTLTVSGGITGTGLSKSGAGTLKLTGFNTYTGGTTVSAGILWVTTTQALGLAGFTVTVANGAQLDIDNNITIAQQLNISGSGTSGAGVLHSLFGSTNSLQ